MRTILTGDDVDLAYQSGKKEIHVQPDDIITSIAKEKAERIEKSGAKTVVTSCPGCVLFLRLGAAISGGDYKVLHISQVL